MILFKPRYPLVNIHFKIVRATFSGDCMQTAPGSTEATGTISVGQHLTCTITNTISQD
jgi:hypothetical protein